MTEKLVMPNRVVLLRKLRDWTQEPGCPAGVTAAIKEIEAREEPGWILFVSCPETIAGMLARGIPVNGSDLTVPK